MLCTQLVENTGCKNYAKKSPAHHRTISSGYTFATKARINNRKNLLNSTISTCPDNMVNFDPLVAEIDWRIWAPQQISKHFASWLRYCSDVTQQKPTKLCRMFGRLLGWYTVYIFGGSCPVMEFCQVKNSLCI